MVRGTLTILLLVAGTALAQPRKPPPPLVGATEVVKLTPPAGFIDDPVAVDGDRLAYVVANGADKAELHVVNLATKQEQTVDLSRVTLYPIALELVGPRAFVVGQREDRRQIGAMVELVARGRKPAGTVRYRVAPADHVTLIVRDRKPRIAVHRVTTAGAKTRHTVELLALETGRRIGAARTFELAGNANRKLDLRVNHWSDGWTRAHGIKGGEWDRKENQRTPDTEATYDLLTRKLQRRKITDLFEQRKRYQILADAGGRLDFVRFDRPAGALQLWRGGAMEPLALDQPLTTYDAASLQAVVAPVPWLALKVDPVNPDAVARKKADPEYLDVFRAGPGGKAVRVARVLAKGVRHRFGVAGGDRFWLLERNSSMERGGKRLTVYRLP